MTRFPETSVSNVAADRKNLRNCPYASRVGPNLNPPDAYDIVVAMKTGRCPICKAEVPERTKNFPFCSARCKLVDAGNWLEGAYRIEALEGESEPLRWGEDE